MNHKITHKGLRGHGAKPHNITRKALKRMQSSIALAAIVLVVCAMVSSVTAQLADTPWPMFHNDLNHTGLSSYYGPDAAEVKWTFPTGGRGVYSSTTLGPDETIYIGTSGWHWYTRSKLYAINPDGTEKWHWTPPLYSSLGLVDFIDSTPAVASDGTLYVGCWNRRLYALYPNGTQKWEFYDGSSGKNCRGFVLTSPAIAPDGTIYMGNNNGKLYAINHDGSLKWSYKTGRSIQSSPAVGPDGTVYVGSFDRKLYAINPDGTLKWKYFTGILKSSPAIGTDGTIYVGSYNKNLYALNPDGTLKWVYPTGGLIVSSPAVCSDGTIYVGSHDKKLYAINPDGSFKWCYTTGGCIASSPAIDADGTVYAGSLDGHIHAINTDGSLLWKYNTGKIYYSSPSIAADGTLYIGTCGGKLYAFDVNMPPVLDPIGPETVDEGYELNITITASDHDGDVLTFSSNASFGTFIAINSTASFWSWTPDYDDAGVYHVDFGASDGELCDNETVKITVNDMNRPPALESICDKTIDETETVAVDVNATDPDGDSLTYSCNRTDLFVDFDSSTGIGHWTTDYDAAGVYYVDFGVYDGKGGIDNETIKITVNDVNLPPVLDAIGDRTVDENETVAVDVNATDPDSYVLAYSCNRTDLFVDFDSSTGIGHWITDYCDAGTYYVDFGVSDGTGGIDNETVMIIVTDVNRVPELEPVGDKELNESETLTVDVDATDQDNDVLTYSCNRTDLFTDFNPDTGAGHWITDYNDVGTYYVNFGVCDGKGGIDNETVEITVHNKNRPPVLESIGDKTVNESELLEFTLNATDLDGDTLTYSASNLPSGATFDAGTRTFSWTPSYVQSGTYLDVHFEVSDGELSDWENITIAVNTTNRPPELDTIGDKTVNESDLLEFTINGTDPDEDTLTYSASNLPSGATFDAGARTFSWMPSYVQSGTYPDVHFEVSDGELSDYECITIVVNDLNRPPELEPIGDKELNETETLTIDVNATDPDGDSLTYSCNRTDMFTDFSVETGVGHWATDYNDAGIYYVAFDVSDGKGGVDNKTVKITVNDMNRVPELDSIGDSELNEGETLTIDVNASDPDGDVLTYSCNRTDLFSDFDSSTGIGHWTTDYDDAGIYYVEFDVSDGKGGIDSETVKITVNDVNSPPELELIAEVELPENETLTVDINASDPDGDSLTYSCNCTDLFTDFCMETGVGHWTPDYDDAGTYYINFGVSDGELCDNETVEITVNDVNRAPVLDPIGDKAINEGDLLEFAITATDLDGDSLAYFASNLPAGASFNSTTRKFSWATSPGQAGVYPDIRFEVTDGELMDSENITISVAGVSVEIRVEPENTSVQPQDQFDVNITVDSLGNPVYGVQYCLHYDVNVVRAETQVKGPFLGNYGETIVVITDIDHRNGIISYAETRKGDVGVTGKGTIATIQFTVIGHPGAKSGLNFSDVIIVNPATDEPYSQVNNLNGSITIFNNTPPIAIGVSKHRINNVAKKYPCETVLCSCSYDPDYPDMGGNITYIRWAFGDGQYGTSEGIVPNCTCKEHKYESWQWEPFGDLNGDYVTFNTVLTVTDDGCPELTNTTEFDVNVFIAGDANGDGRVNILDAVYVGKHWGERCDDGPDPEPCYYYWTDNREQQDKADLNNDCVINILDAVIIGANWGYVAW